LTNGAEYSFFKRMGCELKRGKLGIDTHKIVSGINRMTDVHGMSLNIRQNYVKFIPSPKIGPTVRLKLYNQGNHRKVVLPVEERPILPGDFIWENEGFALLSPLG
jgi:hypothetical protein